MNNGVDVHDSNLAEIHLDEPTAIDEVYNTNEPLNDIHQNKVKNIPFDLDHIELPKSDDSDEDNMTNTEIPFTSDSDYEIFEHQITSDVPLQRFVGIKRMIKSMHLWTESQILSIMPTLKQLSSDKEMVIRQNVSASLGPFAQKLSLIQLDETACRNLIITQILPIIAEMLKDSMEVRQEASSSIIIIAKLLKQRHIQQHILPIFMTMASEGNHDQKMTAIPVEVMCSFAYICSSCKQLTVDWRTNSNDRKTKITATTPQIKQRFLISNSSE